MLGVKSGGGLGLQLEMPKVASVDEMAAGVGRIADTLKQYDASGNMLGTAPVGAATDLIKTPGLPDSSAGGYLVAK